MHARTVHVLMILATAIFCATAARVYAAPADDLALLLAESWEFSLVEDPLFATHTGDARFNDRLPRETLADQIVDSPPNANF